MPEAQLPTESTARSLFAPLETPLGQLTQRLAELRNAPRMTRMQKRVLVDDVNEWDKEAQKYLKAADESEAAKHMNNLFKAHRFVSGLFKKVVEPVIDGRRWASGVFAQWDAEEKARLAEERRQREEAARKEQERQRLEEAAHLEAQGHKEDAIAHLESPLPPVVLPDAKAQPTKPAGVSVIEVYKPDEDNWLLDGARFYAWMVQHPECHAMMKPELGKWKSYLTNAKGKIRPDGMNVVLEKVTRNRG